MGLIDINVGARVSGRRKALGLSELNIADTLDLDASQLGSLERGRERFTAKQLFLLCTKLELRPTDLYENCMSAKGPARHR